jgi:Rrf2 family protein
LLTQTAKYAIRALIHLADQDGSGYSQTREMADLINVPSNYLGKTLQKLAHARVLDSQKGLHGGFRMSRSPQRISLYEILIAIEALPRDFAGAQDDEIEDEKVDGLPTAVYAKFAELSGMYIRFLKDTSLADLIGSGVSLKK